jgi:membrane associated rhomboid family serine protease
VLGAHAALSHGAPSTTLGLAFRPADWIAWFARGERVAPPAWSVFTYCFAHLDWAHAVSNAAAIALLGGYVARRAGVKAFWAAAGLGALAGALGHSLAARDAHLALVGASSIAAALAGFASRTAARAAGRDAAARRRDDAAALAGAAVAFIVMEVALGAPVDFGSVPNVEAGLDVWPTSWRAHAAGFLAGFGLAGFPWGSAARVDDALAARDKATHPSATA